MLSKTWKKHERDIAKLFNTTRTPLSGGNSKHTQSDTLSDNLYIECKQRKRMANWSLFRDTEKKAKTEGKIPLVVLKESNKHGVLFVCRPEDMKAIVSEMKL